MKTGIELKISCPDTMLNYRLFQKLKLSRNGEFNHLTIILTYIFLTYQKKEKKIKKTLDSHQGLLESHLKDFQWTRY